MALRLHPCRQPHWPHPNRAASGSVRRGRKAAWLTVYNPEDSAQDVWVHLYVDGATTPVGLYANLQGHTRFAWHINAQLLNLDPTSINRNSNFATEVFFERQGVATLALWELGDSHGYLRSSYLEGTERCVMWTTTP